MELGYINPIDEGIPILVIFLVTCFIVGVEKLNNIQFLFQVSYLEIFVCVILFINVLFILASKIRVLIKGKFLSFF